MNKLPAVLFAILIETDSWGAKPGLVKYSTFVCYDASENRMRHDFKFTSFLLYIAFL